MTYDHQRTESHPVPLCKMRGATFTSGSPLSCNFENKSINEVVISEVFSCSSDSEDNSRKILDSL